YEKVLFRYSISASTDHQKKNASRTHGRSFDVHFCLCLSLTCQLLITCLYPGQFPRSHVYSPALPHFSYTCSNQMRHAVDGIYYRYTLILQTDHTSLSQAQAQIYDNIALPGFSPYKGSPKG